MAIPPQTITNPAKDIPDFAKNYINLASACLGAKAVYATNQFFAPLERMLQDSDAVFIPDYFDDHGKWMDGWETKRRRNGGHDYAIIQLATVCCIKGFDIDTSHFTGNYPPAFSLEACLSSEKPDEKTIWTTLIAPSPLQASHHHFMKCSNNELWSHIRIHIYPDGGIARLRVYGAPYVDQKAIEQGEIINVASSLNGAKIIAFSDAHYGEYERILAPDKGLNMGDGWETRRRRTPGFDWIIIKLAGATLIDNIVVDTSFYKGNYPDKISIDGADLSHFKADLTNITIASSIFWEAIVEKTSTQANHEHLYKGDDIQKHQPVTHIRLNLFPDGGISRIRVNGTLLSL